MFPGYFQQFRHQLNAVGLKNRAIINIITTITISNKIMFLPKVPEEQAEVNFILLCAPQFWAIIQEHNKSCFRVPTTGSKTPEPEKPKC